MALITPQLHDTDFALRENKPEKTSLSASFNVCKHSYTNPQSFSIRLQIYMTVPPLKGFLVDHVQHAGLNASEL